MIKAPPILLILVLCLFGVVTVHGEAETRPQDPLADFPSTDGDLFVANLEKQIRYLESRVRQGSVDLSARQALADALGQKGLIHADLPAIGAALEIADGIVELTPGDPESYLLRARLSSSLHRFAAAREDLAAAQAHGASQETVRPLLAEVLWNLGRRSEAAALSHPPEPSGQHPVAFTPAAWLTRAHRLLDQRNDAAATAAIEAAMRSLRDSSPLPAASLYLLRARAAEYQGRPREIHYFLERAVERLPQHVGALESLADHLLADGEIERAIELLKRARRVSPDPHLLLELARAHRQQGDFEAAHRLEHSGAQELRRFRGRYPEVYAAEATELSTHHHHLGEAR